MNRFARTAGIGTATVAAAALLAIGGAAPALADTSTDATTDATTSVTTPGSLSVNGSPARPGQTVTFDGTCASSNGPDYPTVGSVTSSAFSSVSMDRTNPDAFDGTATIASGATPGAHTVTAHCSNGAVSSSVTVIGTHPTPPPTPINGGGGTGTHGTGTGTGTHVTTQSSSTQVDNQFETLVDEVGSSLPWVLGALILTVLAGAGAYVLGRGRREDREREAYRQAREDWEARQAWEAQQAQQGRQFQQGRQYQQYPQARQYQQGPRGPMSYR